MSTSIDQAFVKQFQAEVHEAYQRLGSKLRGTVRVKTNVVGASTVFQKVGKGTATTKPRHGQVPVMNLDHTAVECSLLDYYAGDWIDRLDELKINHDERQVVANAGAHALGRKTDELIIAALDTATQVASGTGSGLTDSDGMTKAKALLAFEMLADKDVPDDGNRFAVVGYKQWSELLGLEEFSSADFIGPEDLPWKSAQAKRWLGTTWILHTGLTKSGALRYCYWYHRTALGHASGQDVMSDITWHGDRAAFFVNNMMSQGTVLIDADGVVRIRCAE